MKSWIDISAERLRANFAAVQQAAGPAFEVLCVIKANAYGHSARLCAQVLVEAGALWLGVAELEEGIAVRDALLRAGLADRPVHVVTMCGFEPEDAPGIVANYLTPVVWTPEHIHALERAAASLGQRISVHLEIDTGMARQGASPGAELSSLLAALRGAPHVRAEGIFSHLSSSEVARSPETTHQLARFGPALSQLGENDLLLPDYLHLANSSGIDEGSTMNWVQDFAIRDLSATPLVRPGLALYGYTLPIAGSLLTEPQLSPRLQPVATWKTRVIGVRDLHPGETVGYGATFLAQRPMRVALLPVGYADGFRREASSGVGNGWVMVQGQRAPVVGRVSMNLTVVDITDHTAAPRPGDEATLLGQGVTAQDHADWAGTILYEILCGMRGHHRLV